ncbi:DUF1829 domain-containing protein [Pontibacillus halophilus]
MNHKFDYLFHTKKSANKVVKLVNSLDSKNVKSILFSWDDAY